MEKPTVAVMFLSNYGLRCSILTGKSRLLDVLNDVNSKFLPVTDARFFQRQDFQSVLDVHDTLVVKSAVQLVVIDEPDEKEEKLFYATLERKVTRAVISLPTVMVEGTLHVKAARDPQAFLSVEARSFVPVTNATIYQLTASAKKLESRVALIRADAISSISFGTSQESTARHTS